MRTIELYTEGQKLLAKGNDPIATGSKNTIKIHVAFGDEWAEYTKTGVFFTDATQPYEVVMDSDTCTIPAEVLADDGTLFIGVRGVKSGASVFTSLLMSYVVKDGAPEGAGTEVAPSEDVYEQILSAYGKLYSESVSCKNSLNTKATKVEVNALNRDLATQEEELEAEKSERKSHELLLAIKCETEESEVLNIKDSTDYQLQELHIYGKSTQDGTPTPYNPIEIVNVENPTLTINNNADLSQTKQFDYLLRGIGDVKDELIIYADGSGKLIQRIGIMDNSKIGDIYQSGKAYYFNFEDAEENYTRCACNKFAENTDWNNVTSAKKNNIFTIYRYNTWKVGRAAFYSDTIQSSSDLSAIVKSDDFVMYYELLTPITTELTAEQMQSYYPVTNISTDTNATLKVKYVADTKNYIDNKISELSAALVDTATMSLLDE